MSEPTSDPQETQTEVFDVSDIVERAAKTAAEVFIVNVPVFAALTDVQLPVLLAAASAAGAAALSVVLNAVLQWSRSRKSRIQL